MFSTLHTTDATQTINRVLSFYPPHQQAEVRFSLASALQAVVNGAVFDATFNVFFKLKYNRLYDAMLATPLGPVDIALG